MKNAKTVQALHGLGFDLGNDVDSLHRHSVPRALALLGDDVETPAQHGDNGGRTQSGA